MKNWNKVDVKTSFVTFDAIFLFNKNQKLTNATTTKCFLASRRN